MTNEGVESMILTVQIEGMKDSGKHRITYFTILLKMVVKKAVRFIAKGHTLLRSAKDMDITYTHKHASTYSTV